eukprot:403352981
MAQQQTNPEYEDGQAFAQQDQPSVSQVVAPQRIDLTNLFFDDDDDYEFNGGFGGPINQSSNHQFGGQQQINGGMSNNNASPSKYQNLNGDMQDEYNYDEILEDAEGNYQTQKNDDQGQMTDEQQIQINTATNGTQAVPGGAVPRRALRQIKNFQVPEIIQFDIDTLAEKPWREQKDKMSDYFNFGFNEDSWKKYRQYIMQNCETDLQRLNDDQDLSKIFSDNKYRHAVIDFYLPHEYGGLGDCMNPQYSQLNTFPETMDLPLIKPKTTLQNKNEFNVNIEKTAQLAGDHADMSLFTKHILMEPENADRLKELQDQVKLKRQELDAEKKALKAIEEDLKKNREKTEREAKNQRSTSKRSSSSKRDDNATPSKSFTSSSRDTTVASSSHHHTSTARSYHQYQKEKSEKPPTSSATTDRSERGAANGKSKSRSRDRDYKSRRDRERATDVKRTDRDKDKSSRSNSASRRHHNDVEKERDKLKKYGGDRDKERGKDREREREKERLREKEREKEKEREREREREKSRQDADKSNNAIKDKKQTDKVKTSASDRVRGDEPSKKKSPSPQRSKNKKSRSRSYESRTRKRSNSNKRRDDKFSRKEADSKSKRSEREEQDQKSSRKILKEEPRDRLKQPSISTSGSASQSTLNNPESQKDKIQPSKTKNLTAELKRDNLKNVLKTEPKKEDSQISRILAINTPGKTIANGKKISIVRGAGESQIIIKDTNVKESSLTSIPINNSNSSNHNSNQNSQIPNTLTTATNQSSNGLRNGAKAILNNAFKAIDQQNQKEQQLNNIKQRHDSLDLTAGLLGLGGDDLDFEDTGNVVSAGGEQIKKIIPAHAASEELLVIVRKKK